MSKFVVRKCNPGIQFCIKPYTAIELAKYIYFSGSTMKPTTFILLISLMFCLQLNSTAQDKNKVGGFKDSLDNAIDMSDFLLNKKGVLIVPSLITEPAVGYGVLGAAIYFHSAYTEKNGPPSMSGILGGGTQNGTWLAGGFHVGYWNHDRIRYMGALIRTDANVDFYGSVNDEPFNLNLDAWLLLQQIKFRVATSHFFLGGRYLYLNTNNTFAMPVQIPEFQETTFNSKLGELSLLTTYDTRNNVFSPKKGFYLELTGTYADNWLGSDDLYGRIASTLIGYFPVNKQLFVGLRHQSTYSLGDIPFYARPVVMLRGAPITKYQNKNVTLIETEVDWNLYKRWSLVGFTGLGNAFKDYGSFDKGKSVATIGTGFRYLLMRKLGAQMGMDIAASSGGDTAFYIVFGCAWLR